MVGGITYAVPGVLEGGESLLRVRTVRLSLLHDCLDQAHSPFCRPQDLGVVGCAQVQLDVVAVAELLELPRGEVIPVVASDHFSDAKDAEPVLELVNHIPCHCLPHLLEHG